MNTSDIDTELDDLDDWRTVLCVVGALEAAGADRAQVARMLTRQWHRFRGRQLLLDCGVGCG